MGSRFSVTLCWISMDGTARPSFRLDVEQLKRPYVQNRRASVLKSVRTITRASLIDIFGEGGGFPHYSKFHSFLKSRPCIVSTPTFTDCSASVSMTREALKKNVRGYARKEERVLVQGREAFVVFLLGFPSR